MDSIKSFIKSEKPVKWLFYGDSITHGAVHTFGYRDYTELFSERIRTELGRTQDAIINMAISGNTTKNLVEQFDWRVKQFSPDVVFLMIGMNDCSTDRDVPLEVFKNNLDHLADLIKQLPAELVLQTTCPILPNTSPERTPNFPKYMDAIRDCASEKDLPIIDHHKLWLSKEDKLYYWMDNAFHPNNFGHQVFAETIYKALDIYDENASSCKFFVP